MSKRVMRCRLLGVQHGVRYFIVLAPILLLCMHSPAVAQDLPAEAGSRSTVVAWWLDFLADEAVEDPTYLSLPGLPFHEYEAFTIEAWTRGWEGPVFSQGVVGDPENSVWVSISWQAWPGVPHTTSGFEDGSGNTFELATERGEGISGWNHHAMLYDGKRLRIFINGGLSREQECPPPGPMEAGQELVIGAHQYGGGPSEWNYGRGVLGPVLGPVRISQVARYQGDFEPSRQFENDDETLLLFDPWTLRDGKLIDRSRHRRHATLHGDLRGRLAADAEPASGAGESGGAAETPTVLGDAEPEKDAPARRATPSGVQVIDVPMEISAFALSPGPEERLLAIAGLSVTAPDWRQQRSRPARIAVVDVDSGLKSDGTGGAAAVVDAVTLVLNTPSSRDFVDNRVYSVTFVRDGSGVVVAGTEDGALLWDPDSGEVRAVRPGKIDEHSMWPNQVKSVDSSPDGSMLALAGGYGVTVWSLKENRALWRTDVGKVAAAFSRDGSVIATFGNYDLIHLWDALSGQQLAEARTGMSGLYSVAWHPDGQLFVVGGEGGTKTYDAALDAGQLREHGTRQDPGVRGLELSPDGTLAATVGYDGIVKLWEPSGGGIDRGSITVEGTASTGPVAFLGDQRLVAALMMTGGDPRLHRPALLLADVSEALSPSALEAEARAAGEELVRAVRVGDGRRMYALALAMDAHSAPAAPALIEALRQADPEEAALRHAEPEQVAMFGIALGRIGAASPEIVPGLSRILREHENIDVRGAALTGLAQLDPEDVRVDTDALAHTITEDESPALRRIAMEILSRVDEAVAQQALQRARQGPQPDGKIHERDGQWFFEGRSLESWIEHLSVSFVPNEIYGRPGSEIPLKAITALGEHAVPTLIEALESTRWPIRRAAAAGLEALGPQAEAAVPHLLEMLNDESCPDAAADALVAICRDGEAPLRELSERLSDEHPPPARISAARALVQLDPRDERPVRLLVEMLRTDMRTRSAALEALKKSGSAAAAATPELAAILSDRTIMWFERAAVAELLGAIGPQAAPALPAMIDALGDEDNGLGVRVADSIARLGEIAIPPLLEALGDQSPYRRQNAGRALREIGQKAVPALQRAAGDANAERAQAARKVLEEL